MSVLSDGNVIVGDGDGDPVALAAFTDSTGQLKHERGGIETDISGIAKGGILAGSAAGTIGITTVGSEDQVLTVDGSGGIGWETPASGGMASLVADTTPQLGGQLDVNGNAIGDGTLELLKFSETGSAVNELTITNAATGNPPALSATGGDANINLKLAGKGTGGLEIGATATTASKLILAEDTDNGAHTITVAAPAAVTGDITLTLPDGDGDNEQFLQTNGSGVLSWAAAAAGGGITEADSWELTVGFVGDKAPIDDNLLQVSSAGFGCLGTGMSENGSGIFSFPSTGYWAVLALFNFRKAGDSDYNQAKIAVSVDSGSSYAPVSLEETSMTQHDSVNMRTSCTCFAVLDVTDVAVVKVRFDVSSRDAGTSVNGGGGYNSTSFHFLRLADRP